MEMFDDDLKGLLGDIYDDGETVAEMPVIERKPRAEQKEAIRSVKFDGESMKRLKSGMVWSLVCGGIAMLLWWFQLNDLMDIRASYPCILACALLAGYGVGKNVMVK